MGKLIKNGIAYFRGILLQTFSQMNGNHTISSKVRVFASATLDFDKKAMVSIAKGAKVRERAVISVRNGGVLEIGENASVGMDCKIAVHDHVVIGNGTLLSPNILIYDHDHVFDYEVGVHRKEFKSTPVIIGKNCWIGANTVILRGSVIGDNCVIGAGSVVKGNIPNGSIFCQKRDAFMVNR